jgi:hypothetical protein
MILLETIKRIAEKTTGWKRPNKPQGLVRERRPQIFRFNDDGLIPNHPRWPLIIYKGGVRLAPGLDPAAVFEELFDSHGASTKPSVSRGAAGRCDSAGQTGASSLARRPSQTNGIPAAQMLPERLGSVFSRQHLFGRAWEPSDLTSPIERSMST